MSVRHVKIEDFFRDNMNHVQTKKKPSKIWNHFTLTLCKKKAICLHCQTELAYSIITMSNLHRHVKNKHPEVFAAEFIKNAIENSPVEIITVQEVGETFEISTKGFDEIEDITHVDNVATDSDWVPDTVEEELKFESSVGKKKRKFERRSVIWNHFERSADKTVGTCMHCHKKLRIGTTSNLARHMRHKHPTVHLDHSHFGDISKISQSVCNDDGDDNFRNEMNVCTQVIEVNVDNSQNPVNIVETKTDVGDVTEVEFQDEEIPLSHYLNQESQTEFLDGSDDFNINDFIRPKSRAVVVEQVDHQLVKTLMKCCLPVNLVEQPNFKELINLLNSKYVLPSSNKVCKELIPHYYQECEERARTSLKEAEAISLYLDQWKSKTTLYLCVTAHFINNDCQFESLFLSCHALSVNITSTDMSDILLKTVTKWEIEDKILTVVTDNAETITVAVALCNWLHIPHFVQSLTLVVYECLREIKQVIAKVNCIVDEITKLPDVLSKIYSTQKRLKLPQVKLILKVKNDWNSSFTIVELLSRFIKLKEAINEEYMHMSSVKLNEQEWKLITGVTEILSPFKDVKKEIMDEERVIMSKVVFYIRALKKHMRIFQNSHTLCTSSLYIATVAEAALTKHFEGIEGYNVITNALLLDPRMKRYVFEDESEFANAWSLLKKEVCEVSLPDRDAHEPNPKSLWRFFDEEVNKMNTVNDPIGKGILEMDRYLQEQLLDRNENPLVWWKQRSAIYPRLLKLVKKYFCLTATSGSRESISYKSAYMLSQLKNKNNFPSASEAMFLHHNMS